MSKPVGELPSRVWGRVLAVIAVALVSTVSPSLDAGASGGNGLNGKSATQVWDQAVAAAKAEGSVHFVVKPYFCCGSTNLFGTSGVLETDAGKSEGKQSISGGTYGHVTILVVPGKAYVQPDAHWASMIMTISSAYAGKWLAFSPNTPGYSSTINGVTLSSLLSSEKPAGRLTVRPKTTIDGKKVIGLSGGLIRSNWPTDVRGSAVVYISAVAPYLPVETVYGVSENGVKTTVTGTFSKWGEPISVTAPASSIPYIA